MSLLLLCNPYVLKLLNHKTPVASKTKAVKGNCLMYLRLPLFMLTSLELAAVAYENVRLAGELGLISPQVEQTLCAILCNPLSMLSPDEWDCLNEAVALVNVLLDRAERAVAARAMLAIMGF